MTIFDIDHLCCNTDLCIEINDGHWSFAIDTNKNANE